MPDLCEMFGPMWIAPRNLHLAPIPFAAGQLDDTFQAEIQEVHSENLLSRCQS